ncbi:MAG: hypothetical protein AAF203_04775 [Pseudomonadota bacterium]
MLIFLAFFSSHLFCLETLDVIGTRSQSPEQLQTSKNEDLEETLLRDPSLTYSSGARRPRFYQIRGIGERSQFDNFNQSPVGFFLHDIDFSEEANGVRLAPFQKIKIKTTPQSLDLGSKGLGGAIQAESCHKDECRDDQISVGADSFQTGFTEVVTQPLWNDQFDSQLQLFLKNSEGYQKNDFYDRPTGDSQEISGQWHNHFRGFFDIESHHIFSQQDHGYDFFSPENDFTSHSDRPGREKIRVQGHSLILKKDLNDWQFRSSSSFTLSEYDQSFDEDWGNDVFWNALPGWNQNYDFNSENRSLRRKWHQKFSISSELFEIGWHSYFLSEEINNRAFRDGALRSQLQAEHDLQAHALWARKTFESPSYQLTLGARYEIQENKRRFLGTQKSFSDQFWAAEIQYLRTLTQSLDYYLLSTQSFRGGGFNLEEGLTSAQEQYGGEDIYLLETGLQYQRNHWQTQLKGFFMVRENMQLRSSFQDDPADPSSFTFFTDNAARAQVHGMEWDFLWQYKNWETQLSVAGLFSKFTDYSVGGEDLSGRRTPYAPTYSFYSHLSCNWSQMWSSRALFYGKEAFYFSNSHSQTSQPFQLFDLILERKNSQWEIRLWAKNLFQQGYSLRGFYFANEPPNFETRLYTQPAPPRSFGLEVKFFL